MALTEKYTYCAFLDVLGYGNIVLSGNWSNEQKIEMLENIYMNNFATASWAIKQINKKHSEKIFIKSYSDSIYLESDDPAAILFTIYNFFNKSFGYNALSPGKYTPLIRAGVVYDWTLRIMDTGSLSRHEIDEMPNNEEYKNVIGLGVARSYYTAEKSNLSGMRVIISPEVISKFDCQPFKKVSFECYTFTITNYLHDPLLKNSLQRLTLFLLPVRMDEKGQVINLYELCWPVFKYEFKEFNSDIDVLIQELVKMEDNFTGESIRHLKRTAELMHKSLLITLAEHQTEYPESFINWAIPQLTRLSGTELK
jgi:hypothetical protein